MKKLKRKLLTVMLYTAVWRNVDKHVDIWIFTKYDLLGGRNERFYRKTRKWNRRIIT